MSRKCHNHRPHTKLWHHKEQTQNSDNHKTARAQYKLKVRSLFLIQITAKLERMQSTTFTKQEHKSPTNKRS